MTDPNNFNHQGDNNSEQDLGGAQTQYENDKIDALMSWDSGQDYSSIGSADNEVGYQQD